MSRGLTPIQAAGLLQNWKRPVGSKRLPVVAKSVRGRLSRRCCSWAGLITGHILRELAGAMRGVSPTEIDAAIADLNSVYDADGAPYRIDQTNGGYRMVLREEFERIRDKFYGRVKEARLSPAVMEVLSVLAYNQPATAEQVSELRGASSGAALATLVRRRLVKLERPADAGMRPQYSTTDRFLKLFGLESLEALPRAEELEKA